MGNKYADRRMEEHGATLRIRRYKLTFIFSRFTQLLFDYFRQLDPKSGVLPVSLKQQILIWIYDLELGDRCIKYSK
jgi:hypothetical protein